MHLSRNQLSYMKIGFSDLMLGDHLLNLDQEFVTCQILTQYQFLKISV